jgi:CheY-like chemotaxis protein
MLRAAILLVDDEPLIQQYVSLMIRRMGYEVAVAADGHDALEQVQRQPFDGAVIDYGLPGIDGLETLAQIRLVRPGIAAVLSSGTFFPELVARCHELDARTLEKPYHASALAELLAEIVPPRER